MLISNFNLCKTEWLELVFAKRNKEYGAYHIRQHYADTMVKAMVIAFVSITAAASIAGVMMQVKPITERIIPIDNSTYIIPSAPPKVIPPKPKVEAPKVAAPKLPAPTITAKFIPMVASPDPVAIDPPKLSDLTSAVGQTDTKTGDIGINAGVDNGSKTGAGTGADNTDIGIYKAVEVMPEPDGGAAAWAKFLQKNLHYPGQALDQQMSGRVYVSFIVEKDGHLSNITVDRGAGYGMDEEATRVLKLAKAWKPGRQNGQPVRVKFTLPVNFSLGE